MGCPLPCTFLSLETWFGIYSLSLIMALTLIDFPSNVSKSYSVSVLQIMPITRHFLSVICYKHCRRKCQPTPVFLPEDSHGQRSLTVHGVAKSPTPLIMHACISTIWGFPCGSAVKNSPAVQETQKTWVQSLGQEDPLEEGMATHSSILARKIP